MIEQSYLYIIECVGTEWVKVGISKDPFGRVRSLQTGCPYVLSLLYCQRYPNAEAVEARLHCEMDEHRSPASNEFFSRRHPAIARILGGATSGLEVQAMEREVERVRALLDHQRSLTLNQIPF